MRPLYGHHHAWTCAMTCVMFILYGTFVVNVGASLPDDSHVSPDTDLCEGVVCPNGGTCQEGEGVATCACAAGWTGEDCTEEVDFCAPTTPCANGGTCANVDGGPGFTCSCITGYAGDTCDTEIDYCEPLPCANSGTCETQIGSYSCQCAEGFAGDNCETNIDECAEVPCQNGGTCVDGINEFTCECTGGAWTGVVCQNDVNECEATPTACDENADCENTDGSFLCTCRAGYSGDGLTCLFISECDLDPCEHGGICIREPEDFSCMCIGGWTGKNCSIDVDECETGEAGCDSTFGVCTNQNGNASCTCAPGSRGDGQTCTEEILYGYEAELQTGDDELDGPYIVPGGFAFSGDIYHEIYVSINGYVTFGAAYDRIYHGESFPVGIPIIAPYWMDLETSDIGGMYVNTYDLNSDLSKEVTNATFERVKLDAATYSIAQDFSPSYIMVATWASVTPYPASLYGGKENVTFQVVLATNSQSSMVVYSYDRSRMYLDPESADWAVTLGYSDGKGFSVNLKADPMRPDLGSSDDVAGRYVYSLTETPVVNGNLKCLIWSRNQLDDDVNAAAMATDPCPCSMPQVQKDFRFTAAGSDLLGCYKERFPEAASAHQLCCYDSEGALLSGAPSGGHLYLEDAGPMEEGHRLCCIDSNLCDIYYSKRPSDNCGRYVPPSWALAWGDPHITTLDRATYTYNGLGEYWLIKADHVAFNLQGRTSLLTPNVNATVFTAFAAKANDSAKVEFRITLQKDDIRVHMLGENKGTLIGWPEGHEILSPKLHVFRLSGDTIQAQFANGIGVQVTIAAEMLHVLVSVPIEYMGEDRTQGLLGTFDGERSNEFTMRDGLVLEAENDIFTEADVYEFGKNWTLLESETLFNYAHDGDLAFSDFYFPDFMPTFYLDMLSNISGNFPDANETAANEICGENLACLVDYYATGDKNVSMTTRAIPEAAFANRVAFENRPPVMAGGLPEMYTVGIGQQLMVTLSAADPEGAEVTYSVTTNIADQYTFENGIFYWTPSALYSYANMTAYVKFYASDGQASSLYWPQLNLCGCSENTASCFFAEAEKPSSPERCNLGTCECRPGFRGTDCSEGSALEVCEPNPCYPGVGCSANPGLVSGYACASCPANTIGIGGIKCYDDNECLHNPSPCDHSCKNTDGSYTCTCDEGFQMLSDMSCQDKDECTVAAGDVSSHTCGGVGQYCVNTPGSYTCGCKAGFFQNGTDCLEAARRFGGQLVFKAMQLGPQGILSVYDDDMGDPNSDTFKEVAAMVESVVSAPYRAKYPSSFKTAKVYNIRSGSIIAIFDVFFGDEAPVNGSVLNEDLRDYLVGRGCVAEGPDCQIGPLMAVSLTNSMAIDKDLCDIPEDNNCDFQSTICSSSGGKFFCNCKPGFRSWRDYTNICQDINECEEATYSDCDNDTSVCRNLPGGYECVCRLGYREENGTCLDVCDPSPCLNGGTCEADDNNHECTCQGIWGGPTCEDQNQEAVRLRNIAIGVGVGVGVLCLILLIVLLVICCRQRQKRYSYSCRPISSDEKYRSSGPVAMDSWDTGVTPRARMKPAATEYEMSENGHQASRQNLVEERRYQDSNRIARNQGVENPAYSDSRDAQRPPKVSGEYF